MHKLFKNQYVVASMLSFILFGTAELSFAAAPDATQILPYNTKNSGVNPIPGRPTLVQQGLQAYIPDLQTGAGCIWMNFSNIRLSRFGVSGAMFEYSDQNSAMFCPPNTVMAYMRFYLAPTSSNPRMEIAAQCCPIRHKFDEVI